jgi:hypothetical protein
MLHRRGLVRLNGLDWREIGGAIAASVTGGLLCAAILHFIPFGHGFRFDIIALIAGSLVWLVAAWATLQLLGSGLPQEMRRRLRI